MATSSTATNNAITALQQSLAKAKPGSSEQTQLSIALYDLKKQQAGATVKDEKSTKANEDAKKENVTSSAGALAAPNKRPHNPLSTYSSSTYRLSLYMITPDAFNTFNTTGKWDTKSMLLVVQSAGQTPGVDAPRAPFFGLDLYMDNLSITTLVGTKETGTASTSYEFKFQIYEPFGISFTTDLVQAALAMQEKANIKRDIKQPLNALMVHYMIAVHFYGYDSAGAVVSPAFERFFPVLITKMTSRLDNKTAVYDITANMVSQQVAFSNTRGAILDATTISGSTVGEVLNDLASTLNKKQALKSGDDPKLKREVPDEYRFIFENESGIDSAFIVDKNHFVVGNAPMPEVLGPLNINVRLSDSGKATQVTKQKREIQVAQGATILSIIDQVITQSTYITDVLKVVDKEELDKTQKTDKGYVTNTDPKPLYWYHVTPQVSVKKIDEKRNTPAYIMTYIIQRKEVPYVRTNAAGKLSSYKGPFKKYDYWYTGKNAEILSYEQTFNLLYFVTSAASSEIANGVNNDPAPTVDLVTSETSGEGSLPNSKENTNTIRTSLYSPGDNLHATLKILGDPDYLMTSEAGTIDTVTNKWYGEDFTINPANSQVFIEVGFNQVKDYDTGLGIMPPNNDIYFWDYPDDIKAKTNAMIYMVISLKSRFEKGKFTQELKTVLPPFSSKNNDKPEDERKETTDSGAAPPAAPAPTSTGKSATVQGLPKPLAVKPAPSTFTSLVKTTPEDDNVPSVLVKKPSSIFINQYGRK